MLQVDLTFHFKVSDSCDNETLCDVTVGGACQPFCTYTMGAWGNPTGIRFNGLTTTQTLNVLLQAANSGAITIGQSNTICKFSVSTTSYVLGIMPASGPSTPLATNFTLDYVSDVDASIHLHMVDLNGGLVKNITAKVDAGENVVQLDLSDLAEGVYWVSLAAEKAMQTERLAIFKDHNQANNTRACTALQCDIAGRFFYSIFMTGYAGGSRVVFFIFFPRPPTNRLYLLRFLI